MAEGRGREYEEPKLKVKGRERWILEVTMENYYYNVSTRCPRWLRC